MGDDIGSFSGPQQSYDDFGNLDDETMNAFNDARKAPQRFFDSSNYDAEYNRQVREITHTNNNYYNGPPHRAANINIIVPDRNQIDGPGEEAEDIGANGTRARRFVRLFKKDKTGEAKTNRDERDAWRAAKKALRAEIKTTREKRHIYFKQRIIRRANMKIDERTTDTNYQVDDVRGDGKLWDARLEALEGKRGQVLDPKLKTYGYGYGWTMTEAPLSTISFSMAGVLPLNKPFMDRNAYYRVNHTLMQHNDEEIAQQKLDAMSFFEEQFGLTFKSEGKPIQGEEDDGSLEIPGLATLRHYAISPSLKTRITTAVSKNHPIEANEKVHEAGWMATVIARKGANLGGIFGGDDGKAVKPGTSMSYGYWVFMNPEFQEDHAIIHFESSEPSFFGGASGHVAHHYIIHDLSVIDGIHIKKGAWGTATSMTTERKILGNKKKHGSLYGETEARVQTTINVTHF